MNVQFAIQDGDRLRARGQPARLAHRAVRVARRPACRWRRSPRACMVGKTLARARASTSEVVPPYVSVKEAVFPFVKFPGVDTDPRPGDAVDRRGDGHRRAPSARRSRRPARRGRAAAARAGSVFISVRDARQAARGASSRATLVELGFELVATRGTARGARRAAACRCTPVNKVREGRPHIVDMIKNDEIAPRREHHRGRRRRSATRYSIRREALHSRVTYYTTLAGARWRPATRHASSSRSVEAYRLQDLHAATAPSAHRVDMTQDPDDRCAAPSALRDELQAAEDRRAPERHQGDRRGARARRPVRERRVPRRARAAGLHRRPHHARSRRSSRNARGHRSPSCSTPTAASCSAPRSSSRTRTTGDAVDLPDRRRGRGRHQGRADLDHLADRARADRQVRGRRRRGRRRPAASSATRSSDVRYE